MSITIPDSVISIGIDAFSGCTGLTSITIPDGVTSIDAFSGCTGLRSITIPDSVTQIGMYAFDGCENLAHIVIPNGVTEIGYGTFRNCSALTGLTIPNSVTSIAFDAFDGCTKLIQKENGVSYVDKWMIGCDASVTFVALRDGTVGIAKQAFNNCDALTGIVIPNSVVRINSAALNGCSRLDHITYLGTEKQWNAVIKDPVWNINWCETVYFSEDYTKKFTPITEKTVYVVSGSIAPLRYEPVPSENGQGGGAIVGGNSVPCGTALTAVAEGTVNGVSWYKVYYKKDAGSASIGCYVAKSEVSEVRPADAGYTLEELIEKYHYTKFSSEITAYPYQNSINVRETPSASGKLVETVALPSSLTLYAYGESLSGGATWCLVKTKDGKIGFAWYDSLTLDSTGKALSNIPLSLDHLLSVYKFTRTSATKTASVEVKLWSEPSGDESKVVKKISQGTSVTVVAEGKGTNGRDGYYIVEVEGTYYFALQSAFN